LAHSLGPNGPVGVEDENSITLLRG
jgi:hypothetical protein